MELGEKIRQARLEAGLSQRQLCGEDITRNMLSLIEHGTARPSMKTLALLSQRLGKPIGYFLQEDARDQSELVESAENLRRAAQALEDQKAIYASQLLEGVTSPLLRRERLLLAAKIPGADPVEICGELPSLDRELLLRAQAALETEDAARCEHLLGACEDRESILWKLLMGRLLMQQKAWEKAAEYLERAENEHPEVLPLLEQCFRELGDYKRAYEYACKQR